MNASTPRVFIAATEQNVGKTTASLGLYAALRSRFPRIGFIKPVGQRFTEVDGKRIDEDSILIRDTFDTQTPIEDMSPIAVEPDFTRRYINHANHDQLARRIKHSFDRASWEKDFAIIEGTGHAGVGSVFDLSNATVARLLGSKVVLVTPGGIGRPLDEACLNKALFDREGVEVIGVIMNKVVPEKLGYTADFAKRGLERLGIELLGVLPEVHMLSQPTLGEVASRIHGRLIHREDLERRKVASVSIGAMGASNLLAKLQPGVLLVTPGDREDIIFAAIGDSQNWTDEPGRGRIAGLVLSDDLMPQPRILELMEASALPVIVSSLDAYSIASRIHSMTVKTLPGDTEKISRIQNLFAEQVDLARMLAKITGA